MAEHFYNKNWTFAQCAELATRGSIVLAICSAPIIFGLTRQKGSFFYHNELFTTSSLVMFVYTLYLNVGDTISFALEGMLGTFSAAIAAWIMFGLFDAGYEGDDVVPWWFGLCFGVFFVVSTLVLNFSTLAQVFSLSNFVWHWMSFMNPDFVKYSEDNIFGLTIHLYGFNGIMTAFAGCVMAISSICLPYPILALSKACDVAEDISECISESWDTAIEFYCSTDHSIQTKTRLKQEMGETQNYIGTLQGYVDSSWWEVVWFPKWMRIRRMLFHLNKVTKESFDRLMFVIVRSVSREDFDHEHDQVVEACKPAILKVVQGAKSILRTCMTGALNGGLKDADEEQDLERRVSEVKDATKELTQQFLRIKETLGLKDKIGKSLIDEHVFAFEVCVFGRLVNELAAKFISDGRARRGEEGEKKLEEASKTNAIVAIVKKIFDPEVILDRERLNFSLRNSLTILLGFAVGLAGYHDMIRPYNAGIASTAAVLLSKYGGSAITKNLNRLLGVVIGELVGELVYSLLGWCSWWGYTAILLCTFFWTLSMLFTYYHSAALGSVACLMAAFGTQKFLKGCSSSWVDPLNTYHDVINCVTAIMLMMIIDSLFGLGPPSQKAATAFEDAWAVIIKDVMECLDPNTVAVHEDSEQIIGDLGRATMLAIEAAAEPRYWRTAWKQQLFNSALKCAFGVRLNLICIIYAVADEEGRTEEDNKEDWYVKLLQAKAFGDIRDGVGTLLEQIKLLSKVFRHEDVAPMRELYDPILDKFPVQQVDDAILRLMDEATQEGSAVLAKTDPAQLKTMEEDGPAQLCFVISCLKSLVQDMQDYKFEVLAAPI